MDTIKLNLEIHCTDNSRVSVEKLYGYVLRAIAGVVANNDGIITKMNTEIPNDDNDTINIESNYQLLDKIIDRLFYDTLIRSDIPESEKFMFMECISKCPTLFGADQSTKASSWLYFKTCSPVDMNK